MLSIGTKIDDLERPLSEIQGHLFLKCGKNGEIQLSNNSDTMQSHQSGWRHSLLGLRALRPTYYVLYIVLLFTHCAPSADGVRILGNSACCAQLRNLRICATILTFRKKYL